MGPDIQIRTCGSGPQDPYPLEPDSAYRGRPLAGPADTGLGMSGLRLVPWRLQGPGHRLETQLPPKCVEGQGVLTQWPNSRLHVYA